MVAPWWLHGGGVPEGFCGNDRGLRWAWVVQVLSRCTATSRHHFSVHASMYRDVGTRCEPLDMTRGVCGACRVVGSSRKPVQLELRRTSVASARARACDGSEDTRSYYLPNAAKGSKVPWNRVAPQGKRGGALERSSGPVAYGTRLI